MNPRLRDIERLHVVLLAAVALAALLTGWLAPASVLLGGAVMGVNFRLLHGLISRLLSPDAARSAGVVLALMLGKFALLVGLLALLLWRTPLEPLSFAVGATVLLVAIVFSTLRAPMPAPAS